MRLLDPDDRDDFEGVDGPIALVDYLLKTTEEQATLNFMWQSSTIFGNVWQAFEVQESLLLAPARILWDVHATLPLEMAAEFQPLTLGTLRNLAFCPPIPGTMPLETEMRVIAAELLTNVVHHDVAAINATEVEIGLLLELFFDTNVDVTLRLSVIDLLGNLCCDPAICLLVIYALDERKPKYRYRHHSGAVYFLDLTDAERHAALRTIPDLLNAIKFCGDLKGCLALYGSPSKKAHARQLRLKSQQRQFGVLANHDQVRDASPVRRSPGPFHEKKHVHLHLNLDGLKPPPTPTFLSTSEAGETIGSPKFQEVANDGPAQLGEHTKRVKRLGKGAGGTVYLSLYLPALKLVAVKEVVVFKEEERQMVKHELHALHENLVPLDASTATTQRTGGLWEGMRHHLGTIGQPSTDMAIVMEFMDMGSLQDLLDAKITIPELVLRHCAFCCMTALEHMHRHRMIHRDIKPANILMNRNGEFKIADFGLAGTLSKSESFFSEFEGTVMYMAPERIQGHPYSYVSDLWSMGVALFYLATEFSTKPFFSKHFALALFETKALFFGKASDLFAARQLEAKCQQFRRELCKNRVIFSINIGEKITLLKHGKVELLDDLWLPTIIKLGFNQFDFSRLFLQADPLSLYPIKVTRVAALKVGNPQLINGKSFLRFCERLKVSFFSRLHVSDKFVLMIDSVFSFCLLAFSPLLKSAFFSLPSFFN
ncbi:hypothetical protein P43SY_006634 [Pythium insidiosum]|uniref:mitogen-activated protein kinase kinase n=1 Tax=Pythium insidiosum TaxID=114742 RepID=A0AAD5Q8D7_PYTIN|nr:hypothetical protein P43SY_006634 [Pythium insidiosum]